MAWRAHALAALTAGGGLLNLSSLLDPHWVHTPFVREVLPLGVRHASRHAILVLGFLLLFVSLNIRRRKHRAWLLAVGLSTLSLVFHLTKGLSLGQAAYALFLLLALVAARRDFTVHSRPLQVRSVAARLVLAGGVALLYGCAGFWFLDRRDFGVNFRWPDAVHETLRLMLLQAGPSFTALTHHARWFLDSLDVTGVTAVAYALSVLFAPVVYRLRIAPRARARATAICAAHGRSSQDFFKLWPDKTVFFGPGQEAFLAYRVSGRYAIVLGDPVGPPAAWPAIIDAFARLCEDNDWVEAYHQATPLLLPVFHGAGYKALKIGDDAVVDLAAFTLEGRAGKRHRAALKRVEERGFAAERLAPPLADDVVEHLRVVSDAWLSLPGRRERQFTLGRFTPEYVRQYPAWVLRERDGGRIVAFVNLIPSHVPGEATIDLMRHLPDAPNGAMDALFIRLLEHLRDAGFARFNFGMAPMAGFVETELPTREERAVHFFFQRLQILFNFRGLRAFKAKYATVWEPRYLVYRRVLQLPRVAIALGRVSELSRAHRRPR